MKNQHCCSPHAAAGQIVGKRKKLLAQIELTTTDTNAKVGVIVW